MQDPKCFVLPLLCWSSLSASYVILHEKRRYICQKWLFTNALERFEVSSTHKEVVQNLASVSIGAILVARRKEQQLQWQQIHPFVHYLARGLAFCGHEESEGNMLQMLLAVTSRSSTHDVLSNEWPRALGNHVWNQKHFLLFKLMKQEMYPVMSRCVCFNPLLHKEYEIFEELIGLV